jgi:serine/threonine kinase 16
MAVLNAQYKQPSSAYSQGLRDLIDSMLKTNPKDRPDIHQVVFVTVSLTQLILIVCSQVIEMTDRVLQSLT